MSQDASPSMNGRSQNTVAILLCSGQNIRKQPVKDETGGRKPTFGHSLFTSTFFCRNNSAFDGGKKSHNSWLNWNQLLPYLLRTVLDATAVAIIDTFDIK